MPFIKWMSNFVGLLNWVDILNNFVASLLFSFVIFIIFLLLFLLSNRLWLLRFFGICKTKRLTIFTSNIHVVRYGSQGTDGQLYSFNGIAIPSEESKAARKLQSRFNYFLPSQVEPQRFLSKILISDIDIRITPSPREYGLFEQNSSIISLGFPVYNNISKYVEKNFDTQAKLVYVPDLKNPRNNGIEDSLNPKDEVNNLNPMGLTSNSAFSQSIIISASAIKKPNDDEKLLTPAIQISNGSTITDTSVGFVQKILDVKNNRYVFYVAGNSENSTAGCAKFLAKHWKSLSKEFGSKSAFLVLLKVSEENNDYCQRLHHNNN